MTRDLCTVLELEERTCATRAVGIARRARGGNRVHASANARGRWC